MPIAHVNGTQLYYEDYGQGPVVVFVPGLGATHSMYEPQLDYFKEKFRVVTFDLRGNGQSGALDVPVGDVLNIQCQDVEQLLQLLHIKKAFFVGVSYGGIFLQKFSYLYPNLIQGLVLSDTFCNMRPNSLGKFMVFFGTYFNLPIYYLPRKWLAALVEKMYRKWPLTKREMIQVMLNLRKSEFIKQRLVVNSFNFRNILPGIDVPLIGVVGTENGLRVTLMEELLEQLPDAKLVKLQHSTDPSNLCQHVCFNQIVDQFLKANNTV